jgi:hypothetical protein
MSDVAFLMIAISFLMVAFLTAVATSNAAPGVQADRKRGDLWQLCRGPSLSGDRGLVPLSAVRVERHAQNRSTLPPPDVIRIARIRDCCVMRIERNFVS